MGESLKAGHGEMTRIGHILVVDDDQGIVKLLKTYLMNEGFSVSSARSVAEMRTEFAGVAKIDCVLLDVVLPDEDGWAALRWIRAQGDTPIIMLTGKRETVDKIVGLEMGADDYLSKPFELRELLARIRTILRRFVRTAAPVEQQSAERIEFAEWVLDLASQQLKSAAGQTIHLTQAEYRILNYLVLNPRRMISRDQLMDVVTGRGWEPFDRSIDVHISNLRRKVDLDPKLPSLIRTVRGSGYMFVPNRG